MKQKKTCFWEVERGRHVRLTTLPQSVNRLSKQCWIFNISQPYKPPQLVTGIGLIFFSSQMKERHVTLH
jgi:hypothetical protein